LVIVRASIETDGIEHSVAMDERCKTEGMVWLGEHDEGADASRLSKLFDAVQLAYRSSTSTRHKGVVADLIGTFYAHSADHAGPVLRLKNASSIQILARPSLISPLPPKSK